MPAGRFFSELRRRHVFRVAATYAVVAWVVVQAASIAFPAFGAPPWVLRVVIALAVLGFPLSLVLAWAFELTPEGIQRASSGSEAPPPGPVPRTRLGYPAVVLAVLIVAGGGSVLVTDRVREARRVEARGLLSEIEKLAADERYADAYALALRVEAVLPEDSALRALWPVISDVLTVRTEPAGARVIALPFSDSLAAEPLLLGTTPLEGVRVPRTPHHLRVELDGYAPAERLASSRRGRAESRDEDRAVELRLELVPAAEALEGTVYVPGGPYEIVSPDMPRGLSALLDDYFIDRFEVSNARFREFVTGGGYTTPGLWPSPIVVDGLELEFAEVARRFVDRTGLPGPRGWSSQTPPPGLEDHPVTGVSWYEAAAYCAFRGMALPSVFQWEKAARDGGVSGRGVVMPWGYQEVASEPFHARANFAGTGTVPVDAHPFGISPWGAYGMAGNVKEWTANAAAGGRVATGGSWEDPVYLFSEFGTFDPASSAPSLGFRCARVRASDARRGRDQGGFELNLERITPSYRPVGADAFQALLSHYRYDPRPPEAEVLERVETPDWTRERIAYAGPQGERVIGYLWLPKSAPAPHQVLLYVPASDAFFGTSVPAHVERWAGGLIRSGRAIFSAVLYGMSERPWVNGYTLPDPPTVGFRDLMVRHATEIRLGLDYLNSRNDLDSDRLGYVGISLGAGSRLAFAAVDDRFRAVVLIGGGIDERMKPTLPEADNVNFAPYIRAPKLLINGEQDEEHPWLTRGLPLWNLLREPKKLVLVEGAGHVPPADVLIPAINSFLDGALGPVRR